jgi:bacterioferritin B
MIVSAKLNAAINVQIGNELENSNRYVAIASYFEGECLSGLAKIYFKQAEEEREHAKKFVKFLLESSASNSRRFRAPRRDYRSSSAPARAS